MDVENLLDDHKNVALLHTQTEASVHEDLCMDLDGANRCLVVEDFLCSTNDHDNKFYGTTNLDAAHAMDQELNYKYEFLDDVLQVDQESLCVPTLMDDCSYNFMNANFDGGSSDFDYHLYQVDDTEKLGLKSQHTCALSNVHEDTRELKLPGSFIPLHETTYEANHPCEHHQASHDLHEAFHFTFVHDAPIRHRNWIKYWSSPISHDIPENGNPPRTLDSDQPSSGDDFIRRKQTGNNFPIVSSEVPDPNYTPQDSGDTDRPSTNKRLRKPTRRYIEEFSETKPRYNKRVVEPSMKGSHHRFSEISSSSQKQWNIGSMELVRSQELVRRQDSLGGLRIQVPFVLRVRRGRPRKNCSPFLVDHSNDDRNCMIIVPKVVREPSRFNSDDDSDENASTVRTAKGGLRRKHHRSWTLQEVMRLVDGVSRHGVGRWSRIKRMEFSASAYRTSVDLKDKWRNLLKACGAQFQTKKVVDQRKKHSSISIPSYILMRVRELAAVQPREQPSASQQCAPVSVAVTSIPGKSARTGPGGRTIQKRQNPVGIQFRKRPES